MVRTRSDQGSKLYMAGATCEIWETCSRRALFKIQSVFFHIHVYWYCSGLAGL